MLFAHLLPTISGATLAVALPQSAPPSCGSSPANPLNNAEFGLIMHIPWPTPNGTPVALVATQNGTNEELLLVGQRLAAYPGTPAYTTNTQPAQANGFDWVALDMDVNGTSYGLFAADIGNNYGIATTVNAVRGKQQEEWLVSEETGSIGRKLAAAPNLFLACNMTVNGEPAVVLGWGEFWSNGTAPAGCWATSVTKNCNVPGSAAVCPQSSSGSGL